MKKRAPPRPEELPPPAPSEPATTVRSHPGTADPVVMFPAWTPEDGGYKDGRYYGSQNPGGGHYPAANEATHETDARLCPKCGMQRCFKIPPEWGADYCKEKDGTYECNGCSGRNLMRAAQA